MITRRSMFGLALVPASPNLQEIVAGSAASSYEYHRLASYWCMLCAHYAAEYPQMRPWIAAAMKRMQPLKLIR